MTDLWKLFKMESMAWPDQGSLGHLHFKNYHNNKTKTNNEEQVQVEVFSDY
jgi:hypothetical protein